MIVIPRNEESSQETNAKYFFGLTSYSRRSLVPRDDIKCDYFVLILNPTGFYPEASGAKIVVVFFVSFRLSFRGTRNHTRDSSCYVANLCRVSCVISRSSKRQDCAKKNVI